MADARPDPTATESPPREEPGGPPACLTDRQLVDRVVAGEPEAIVELFGRRIGPTLAFLARKYSVEDLDGDVFLHLAEDDWRRLRTWDGRSAITTWVWTVAIRFLLHRKKGQHSHSPLIEEEVVARPEDGPEAAFLRDERRSRVLDAIRRLPNERERLVILMWYFEGRPAEEIAQELGVSLKNLYVIKHRALKNLQAVLERSGGDA